MSHHYFHYRKTLTLCKVQVAEGRKRSGAQYLPTFVSMLRSPYFLYCFRSTQLYKRGCLY